jgi:uncharacterized protein
MNTNLLGASWLLIACSATAQLSSPLPAGATTATAKTSPASAAKPAASKPMTAASGLAAAPGSGVGTHGAGSPFAPLKPRDDVVPWPVLADIKTKTEKTKEGAKILPVFNAAQMQLNQKTQRIQGFMMPLEPGERQKHFLVSAVPLSCSFCMPGGPEGMVEVRSKEPVKYSMEALVVEGRFNVLSDDPYGLYYRLTDAVAVK